MDASLRLRELKGEIDRYLAGLFTRDVPWGKLTESMRYSLLAGGKRLRPALTLLFCEAAGGETRRAMPLAAAVELIHTYSLIHDDLPAMDDDDLRRGRPTNHVVYGEGRAILAGDALQAGAFELALSAPLPAGRLVEAASYLASCAGEAGMCGGQELDTAEGTDRSLAGLTRLNDMKTGALLRAACVLGVIAAGGEEELRRAAELYALHLARAFQIRDDILDVTGSARELGKTVGSDAANGKPTYASALGVEEAERQVVAESELAKAALRGKFPDPGIFWAIADLLAVRNS